LLALDTATLNDGNSRKKKAKTKQKNKSSTDANSCVHHILQTEMTALNLTTRENT